MKRISAEVGWGYKDVVERLEEKRKVKGKAYFERKVGDSSDKIAWTELTKSATTASRVEASSEGGLVGPPK